MSDRDAFIRRIAESLDDDLPRLVYADWLDDTAVPREHERAEFIRLQCRAAEMGRSQMCSLPNCPCEYPKLSEWAGLRDRWAKLLEACGERWALEGVIRPAGWRFGGKSRWVFPGGIANISDWHGPPGLVGPAPHDSRWRQRWVWCRGFASEFWLEWHDWRMAADYLRAATPVAKVNLARNPVDWLDSDMQLVYIPDLRREFDTDDLAKKYGDDMSFAEAALMEVWPGVKFTVPSHTYPSGPPFASPAAG